MYENVCVCWTFSIILMLIAFGFVLFKLYEETGKFPGFEFPEHVFIICRSAHVTWLMNQENQNTACISRKKVGNRNVLGTFSHKKKTSIFIPEYVPALNTCALI